MLIWEKKCCVQKRMCAYLYVRLPVQLSHQRCSTCSCRQIALHIQSLGLLPSIREGLLMPEHLQQAAASLFPFLQIVSACEVLLCKVSACSIVAYVQSFQASACVKQPPGWQGCLIFIAADDIRRRQSPGPGLGLVKRVCPLSMGVSFRPRCIANYLFICRCGC